jgi:hypothetical protein
VVQARVRCVAVEHSLTSSSRSCVATHHLQQQLLLHMFCATNEQHASALQSSGRGGHHSLVWGPCTAVRPY